MALIDSPAIPMCADFARAQQIDPAGTAGSYRHFAVVELPLPWPADIARHPLVAPAADVLAAAGVRVQGTVPGPDTGPGSRRLAHFRRPPGPFRAYVLAERQVTEAGLPQHLDRLAREAMGSEPAPSSPAARPVTEVLVCSHGRRDACCGARGRQLVATVATRSIDAVIRRTSHTGGHRFAPTALVLPEGTGWAYLDDAHLAAIVARSGDVETVAPLYRGCTGLDGPAVQAAEREAFRSVGWSWFDHHRDGSVLDVDAGPGRTTVEIDHTAPDGARGRFRAVVEVARSLPVPDCGRPLEDARKEAPELRVVDFTTEHL